MVTLCTFADMLKEWMIIVPCVFVVIVLIICLVVIGKLYSYKKRFVGFLSVNR